MNPVQLSIRHQYKTNPSLIFLPGRNKCCPPKALESIVLELSTCHFFPSAHLSAQGLSVMWLQTVYACLIIPHGHATLSVTVRKPYTLLGQIGETEVWSDEMTQEVPKVNAGDS